MCIILLFTLLSKKDMVNSEIEQEISLRMEIAFFPQIAEISLSGYVIPEEGPYSENLSIRRDRYSFICRISSFRSLPGILGMSIIRFSVNLTNSSMFDNANLPFDFQSLMKSRNWKLFSIFTCAWVVPIIRSQCPTNKNYITNH